MHKLLVQVSPLLVGLFPLVALLVPLYPANTNKYSRMLVQNLPTCKTIIGGCGRYSLEAYLLALDAHSWGAKRPRKTWWAKIPLHAQIRIEFYDDNSM